MTDEEQTIRFLEMLRYLPYLKEEKGKIQRLINGFSLAFKDQIEFDEHQSLEDSIRKLEHL